MCATHYGRWYRHGDPLVRKRQYSREPAEIRFWHKVDKGGPNGCWLWLGCVDGGGYGDFRVWPVKVKAHRYAYELLVGPIPEGLQLDHLCRVRNCVNPKHLEPVTPKVNTRRGVGAAVSRARLNALTHCKHGHAFDAENTYVHPRTGFRTCRACRRERATRRRRI